MQTNLMLIELLALLRANNRCLQPKWTGITENLIRKKMKGETQDMQMPPYREQEVTEWFDEYENYVMLWPLHSPELNLTVHLGKLLEQHIRRLSPPPSSKLQVKEYFFGTWCEADQ